MGKKNIFSDKKKIISKLINSKRIILAILLIVILIIMMYDYTRPIDDQFDDSKDAIEDVVAYIGNEKVTFEDIEKREEEIFFLDKNKIIKNIGKEMYKKEISKYILYEELLYRKAESENLNITKEETDYTYEKIKKFVISQLNVDEKEFNERYIENKKEIFDNMEKSIKAYKYLDESSKVDDKEALEYYNSHKDEFRMGIYRDIFISTVNDYRKNGTVEVSKNKVKNIYRKLEEGEKFERLENMYSEDINGNVNGINRSLEMDFTDEDVMAKISNLKIGEYVKEPIVSPYGYHIVKRIGTEEEPFNKVKEEIKSTLTYKKQIKLIEDLKKEYKLRFTGEYK